MPEAGDGEIHPTADEDRVALDAVDVARHLARSQSLVNLGSWEWDLAANRLRCTTQVYRILGLSVDGPQIQPHELLEHVHAEDQALVKEALRSVIFDRREYDLYHRIVRADGEIRRVRATGEAECDEDERPTLIFGTLHDVTSSWEAEQAAHHAEATLRSLLDIAPDALVVTDDRGRILTFSAGAEVVFGYSSDEVLGRSIELLMPERHRERHRAHVHRSQTSSPAARKLDERAPIRGLRKNGEEFLARASLSRFDTPLGVRFAVLLSEPGARAMGAIAASVPPRVS